MPKYEYYFVEGYVVRWGSGKPKWLAPDGQWRDYSDERDVMTNGRALANEQEALELANAKFELNKEWWDKQYPRYKKRDADA